MEEIWKDIEGFDGIYQVSNLGRVRSLDRYVNTAIRHSEVRKTKGRILKQGCNVHGYSVVSLGKNHKTYTVHRLVAKAFIPNPENKPEIDHINTIRKDNRAENLHWVTRSENNKNILTLEKQRRSKIGNVQSEESNFKRKESATKCKIQCIETNTFYESIKDCGRKTGINPSHIGQVCRGIRKTAGGFHWCLIKNINPQGVQSIY